AGTAADLHVQAVVDDRVPIFARSALSGLVEVEWDDAISTEMAEIRANAIAAGERIRARLDVGVARGRPADVLLELSKDLDLLVIGSRHWGPAARVLLGATGEALMHDAACPVLAVPRPTRGDNALPPAESSLAE
ncbi:MAG: universal stress protein, partial [Solirubrobacterales bacterium]|nr:universal stress protein [Solirubrobacterales bacterium]